jgi:hypothetical protein
MRVLGVCVKRDFRSAALGDEKDFKVCSQSVGPGQKPGPSDFYRLLGGIQSVRQQNFNVKALSLCVSALRPFCIAPP